MEALYIHIPFCTKICTYCDFYKMVAKDQYKVKYIDYLVREMVMRKDMLTDIKTIYIGGGTPSSLPIHLLDFLLHHLSRYVDLKNLQEFTIEANPNDITKEWILLMRKYHINRISLGVQSFNTQKLQFLGRNHTPKQAIKAIKMLRKHRIKNINMDLIYGTQNDRFRIVKRDLQKAINLNVTHISTYGLIWEDKTILSYLRDKNQVQPLDEDKEYKIYKKIQKLLLRYDYQQYEISNFAKRKYQSKHNMIYWKNKNYLGLGAGASYYINNIRYTNIMHLEKYYQGIDNYKLDCVEVTALTPYEQMQEEMILGLRLLHGVEFKSFYEKFKQNILDVFPRLKEFEKQKMIKIKKNKRIFIPKHKLYLSNQVLLEFI